VFNGGTYDAFVAKVNAAGNALAYCGYIGGSGDDYGTGIAVDAAGCAYVTGYTYSDQNTFPKKNGPRLTYKGDEDVFVAKVMADGTDLVYCGYLGGGGLDIGYGIAVDASGCAYVTGCTGARPAYFPMNGGPSEVFNGGFDAFVAKISANGTRLYSGYIGGSGYDYGRGIAVDASGCAYVVGYTTSDQATFPETVGEQWHLSVFNGGTYDAFVAKVNAAGNALAYCGYIGGSGDDYGTGIAVNASGCAYVTGYTYSDQTTFRVIDWPPSCVNYNGNGDAFVAQVNVDGTDLNHCGYIGGSGADYGCGIAVDASGCAYVTGNTASTETMSFPWYYGPVITHSGGENDAFVAKISGL
jgi:hypothetical protein